MLSLVSPPLCERLMVMAVVSDINPAYACWRGANALSWQSETRQRELAGMMPWTPISPRRAPGTPARCRADLRRGTAALRPNQDRRRELAGDTLDPSSVPGDSLARPHAAEQTSVGAQRRYTPIRTAGVGENGFFRTITHLPGYTWFIR